MSRRTINIIAAIVLLGIGALIGVTGYILTVGGSGEASGTTVAPTLDLSSVTLPAVETRAAELAAQVADLEATNAALVAAATSNSAEPTAVAPDATDEPTTEAAAPTTEPTAEPTVVAAAAASVYEIVLDESQVSFTLTEELRGQPTTVIGTTKEVAGQLFVDFAVPASSKVGVIRINARTLATDQEFRNRAIRSNILESSKAEYEFIDFTPTAITGLPDKVEVGQEVTFQLVGDLKIREIVHSVTFDVTLTAVSEDRLVGSATAQVTRDQYNLTIPNAPGVANVSNDVTLAINFVAAKVS
ncbi:MAG: YceI family protein [Anaerolineae bacterium]